MRYLYDRTNHKHTIMAYAIGFTNKYYTLWSITSEEVYVQVGNHTRHSGTKHSNHYMRNLSMNEDAAKLKFTEQTGISAPAPDTDLKGHTRSFESFKPSKKGIYLADEMHFGRCVGMKIADVDDASYLNWYVEEISGCEVHIERIENVGKQLIKLGYKLDTECGDPHKYCTAEQYVERTERRSREAFKNSLQFGLNFTDTEKVELEVTVFEIGGFSGHYGYTNIYVFYTSEGKVVTYKGSKEYEVSEGDKIVIKGTIKHNEYWSDFHHEDVKETKILRMKIISTKVAQ
jgi:hypothetical protein